MVGITGLDTSGWDPVTAAYYQQLYDYNTKMRGLGFETNDPNLTNKAYFGANATAYDPNANAYGSLPMTAEDESYYSGLMAAHPDPTTTLEIYKQYYGMPGVGSGQYGLGAGMELAGVPLQPDPNAQYRLVNTKSGEQLYSGTGYDALQQIDSMVPGISRVPSDEWAIETLDPATGAWGGTGAAKVNSGPSGLIKALGTALPIVAAFIPGLGPLASMAVSGMAGAAGAAMQEKDPLMGGLVSGLTAGALKVPLPGMQQGISGALSNAVGGALGGASQGALNAAGEIVVNAPSLLASSVIPGLTNLGVNAATQAALDAAAKTPVAGLDDIVVTAAKNTFPSSLFGSALQIPLPAAVSGAASDAAPENATPEQQDIIVKARAQGVSPDIIANTLQLSAATVGAVLAAAGLSSTTPAATAAATPTTPTTPTTPAATPSAAPPGEIVVAGTPKVAADLAALGPLSLGAVTTEEVAKAVAKQAADAAASKPALSTIDKIQLGLKGAGLLANAIGGNGNGSGTVPAGFGSSSQFNGALPAANLLDSTARTAAGMGMTSPQDWYRYGYGPEQSFMTGVPQGAKNTSTAFTGYKKGGSVSEALSYDNLSPEEKNFVDYHRRNLVVMPYEHDGGTTTIYGMQDDVPGGVMLHPGYIHGRMVDPQSRSARAGALDWAMRSGIDFPVYPDQATADTRETAIHRDIIEPDLQRYESGDRDWLQGYARGGLSVQGAGDGRSDSIDARLSDGEYVMDAETVALLGNGSNKAGAGKLDRLRVNIRKHKGRKLAKGALSADAKAPERYLAGGLI